MKFVAALYILIVVQCISWASPQDRMASGIVKWKSQGENGLWYVCGERLDHNAQVSMAGQITKYVFESSTKHKVNPWGVIGLLDTESRLDRCALGKATREWGVRKKILTPMKRGFSYPEKDVLSTINHPDWKKAWGNTGVDLGIGQVLWHKTIYGPPEAMLQLQSGIEIVIAEMARRAKWLGTSKPWEHWRGIRKIYTKHTAQVVMRARRMGATKWEI